MIIDPGLLARLNHVTRPRPYQTQPYKIRLLIADAVTVVLYSMMVVFAQMEGNVSGEQYALGIVSFFTISLGGLGIGIVCGLLTALITRTTSEVRGNHIFINVGRLYNDDIRLLALAVFRFFIHWPLFLFLSVVEPLAVLGMAYFSYLCAELFHFSGIIR